MDIDDILDALDIVKNYFDEKDETMYQLVKKIQDNIGYIRDDIINEIDTTDAYADDSDTIDQVFYKLKEML